MNSAQPYSSNHPERQIATIGGKQTRYHFNECLDAIPRLTPDRNTIILTDERISILLPEKLSRLQRIIVPSGEAHKKQQTVDRILEELIRLDADKESILIGIGGGVVTDLAGYVASVYMRGMRLALAPTTLLAMVDAAIGGKNGIDIGPYKNMAGTIYQPEFILFDYSVLSSLPMEEWQSGFAEIIKHACIADAGLFSDLQQHEISFYQNNPEALHTLVRRNVLLKTVLVAEDEQGAGKRNLLNFGHTLGHPLEMLHRIPHGHAISLGMMLAASCSEEIFGFPSTEKAALMHLLQQYGLPVARKTDAKQLLELAVKDKKKSGDAIRFILLKTIGEARIEKIPLAQFADLIHMICG